MQFIRFVFTGVISNLINFIIYTSSYVYLESITFSSFIGYVVGLWYSYFFGRLWVFSSSDSINSFEIFKFLFVYALGGFGMVSIIYYLDAFQNLDYRLCWIFGAIFAVFNNFVGSKFYVFRSK